MRRTYPSRWSAIAVAILCVAVVTTLSVTTPGLWISRAAQLRGAHEYRIALTMANGTGGLAIGLLARWLPVHRLGLAAATAYALLMTTAFATSELGPALFLPLAVVGGGLHVYVWSRLLQRAFGLERHLRSAVVLLGEVTNGVGYLFALGGLAPLLLAMNQRAGFALAAAGALLVGAASTLWGVAPPAGSSARSPERTGSAPLVALLFLVAMAAQTAASAIVRRMINPLEALAFRSWLQPASGLVGAGALLALLFWLSLKNRQPTIRVVALGLFCGAGLSLVSLVSIPALHAGWGLGPAFLVALGSGVASFSTTLLLVLASVVTREQLVPLVVAGWFVKDTLVSRCLAPLAEHARGDVTRTVAVTLVATVLLAAAGGLCVKHPKLSGCYEL
jgi:hypothetical protein